MLNYYINVKITDVDLREDHQGHRSDKEVKEFFMKRRIMASLLVLLLSIGFFNTTAMAGDDDIIIDVTDGVTEEELNADSVFVKQSTWGMCTLAAATNIIRRAAMLSGDENWDQITENVVRQQAWCWQGLYYTFTVNGYTVSHETVSSEEEIDAILAKHPEGIEIYDTWVPHGVVLVSHDKENGIWYVADPSQYVKGGVIPIEESLIKIEHVRQVWYVSSPQIAVDSENVRPLENEETLFNDIMEARMETVKKEERAVLITALQ